VGSLAHHNADICSAVHRHAASCVAMRIAIAQNMLMCFFQADLIDVTS